MKTDGNRRWISYIKKNMQEPPTNKLKNLFLSGLITDDDREKCRIAKRNYYDVHKIIVNKK